MVQIKVGYQAVCVDAVLFHVVGGVSEVATYLSEVDMGESKAGAGRSCRSLLRMLVKVLKKPVDAKANVTGDVLLENTIM